MTEIRSYRRVFDLERRIYRVDRLRLNPGGVPVLGVVYFLAILAITLILARLPLLAMVARPFPWYLRDLAFPAASAAVLAVIRVEGRPFHLAAHALLRYRSGPRTFSGLRPHGARFDCPSGQRWSLESLLMLPDGSDSRLRRLRYTGPGALLIAVAHRREVSAGVLGRRSQMVVHPSPGVAPPEQAEVVVLERSARVSVR